MLQRISRWLPLAAAVTAAQACASAPPRASGTTVDSALAVLTFDSAWSRIAHTHYDTAYAGVDWAGVHTELRPRAAAARTLPELRGVIADMLSRLGESHFGLLPREVAGALESGDPAGAADAAAVLSGDAGLEVRLVAGELLVARVDPDGAAADAGVRTGWRLLEIDGRAVAPRIAALAGLTADEQRTARTRLLYQANAELAGQTGAERVLRLSTGDGADVERRLRLRQRQGQVVSFGSLPPTVATLSARRLNVPGGCVGVIRFSMWLVPLAQQFDRAVDEARHCSGIIIDLRGNPGGVAGMVMGAAGHFLTDTLRLGYMKTRTTELRFKANPRRVRADGSATTPFAGRLAVLIDEMTGSTSEFFAEALQAVGRARVFGTRSAGQALPAVTVRLPTGDVLMHVIADFTGPDGSRIEGRGVAPDVVVEITREDLLHGRDAPFEAALDWMTGGSAGTNLGGREP